MFFIGVPCVSLQGYIHLCQLSIRIRYINLYGNFSKDNININISTPTLVHGKFTANATSDKVVCVEMDADGMIIEVNISMEKNTI